MKDDPESQSNTLPEPAAKQPHQASCLKKPFLHHLLIFLACLAICLSLMTGYGLLYLKKQLDAAYAQPLQVIQKTQEQVEHQLQDLHHKLNLQSNTLKKSIRTAKEKTQGATQDWQILKARDYLQLAQLNTELYDNPATSIALMEKAEQLLESVPDEAIQIIRQHLQEAIVTYKAVLPRNTQDLFNQLNLLQSMTKKLKLKNSLTQSIPDNIIQKNDAGTWKARLQQNIKAFEQFIVIRHNDTNTAPILSPLHKTILEDALMLDFQMAQWAIMQKNTFVYQKVLEHAEKNIQRYGLLSDDTTRAMLNTLNTLKNVSIKPAIWDGKALLELNVYLKK